MAITVNRIVTVYLPWVRSEVSQRIALGHWLGFHGWRDVALRAVFISTLPVPAFGPLCFHTSSVRPNGVVNLLVGGAIWTVL